MASTEKNIIETIIRRCRRICGGTREHCFIDNEKQIICIADMIINKVTGIKGIIEMAARPDQNKGLPEVLDRISVSLDELINWVRYLQITHDLRELSDLTFESRTEERRKEKRYPLPGIYQRFITLRIGGPGSRFQALLLDFSPRGVKFRSPGPFDIDSKVECTLTTAGREVSLSARVRHCMEEGGEYVIGAEIEEVSDDTSFNFFRDVHSLLIEAAMQELRKEG